jgi:4,5-dihydroxyphthalate decarboxylase
MKDRRVFSRKIPRENGTVLNLSHLPLTLAISDYDHVADLVNGRVSPQGIDLTCLNLQIEETHFRAMAFREFDLSELSLGKYASLVSQGDESLTAIPVFPLRMARHSSIYVRRDGQVQKPADLAGRRVGIPEWAQTASVYSRGMLVHQYGLDLAASEWVQAGVNQPGRAEKVKLMLPAGVKVTSMPEKSLSDMLVSGEIDAALTAHPPNCFLHNHPNIRRLFEHFVEVEKRYIQETGIFPIMHIIAIKKELLDRNPWIAMNLFTAFEEAKNRSLKRALFVGSRYPIPWTYEYARQAQELIGKDFWPYGIDANRTTLNAFLQYAHEQGVCHRLLQPEELFAPQVQKRFRV